MRKFTDAQIEYVKAHYADAQCADISAAIDMALSSVYRIAYKFGLKKSAAFMASEKSGRLTRFTESCIANQFKKGDVPFNKGMKMSNELYQKCSATMFKTGQQPHNTRSDGELSYRMYKGGRTYIHIRISAAKWVLLHRYLWEQHHGKVPEKHIIRFIDGNSMNCVIENLECISMKENRLRNNTYVGLPEDLKKDIRAVNKLSKKITELQTKNQNQL